MVFQDPMTSLNPVFTVSQISEALMLHMNMTRKQARERTIELNLVGICRTTNGSITTASVLGEVRQRHIVDDGAIL